MTAIFIAAGVTIGAVVGSITKALKATGKAIGNGLKDIGAKIGSLLPGLIGCRQLPFQNCGAGDWLSRRAYLAPDFGGGCFEKYIKKRR